MIISKKKYEEAIAKAVREAVEHKGEHDWLRSRLDGIDREIADRYETIIVRVLKVEERMEALDHAEERMAKRWRR